MKAAHPLRATALGILLATPCACGTTADRSWFSSGFFIA